MKYKVLVNASLPEIHLALSKGQILDDEVIKELSAEIIDHCIKIKWIEATGRKKKESPITTRDE